MNAATLLRCVLPACLAAGLSTGTYANPTPAPSAFDRHSTYGVGMSQEFASGRLSYTLTLSSGAYVLHLGNKYPIVNVWGFYAVNQSKSDANDFRAGGPSHGQWAWDQHPDSHSALDVSGWLDASKHEALVTPASGSVSKSFAFDEFSLAGAPPSVGLQITIAIPKGLSSPFHSKKTTGSIIPEPVPEPSGLLALLGGTGALGGLLIRRR